LYSYGIGNNIELVYLSSFVASFIYMNVWNQTIVPMINILGNRIVFVIFTVITQILILIFAYIFINIFDDKGIFWFLGNIIGFGIIAIASFIYFVKKIQNNFCLSLSYKMITYDNIKEILQFSFPLSIGVLFLWMQSQSYGIIIDKYIGSEFLGFFGVGMAIALAISASFESIIMQYLYPKMYSKMDQQDEFSTIISSIINLIIPIYLFLAIFVSIFSIYIITILVDMKYNDSYIYIIFGIWISFFKMSSSIVSNIAHAKLKTKELIFPYVVGGISTVIGLIFAVNMDEYKYYIPLALMFSGIISFIVMYKKMDRLVKINFDLKNIYFALSYSIPFIFALYLYNYSYSILYSIVIVGVFGIYFLYVLYLLIKRGDKFE
jgi:O-antigen/teichoic acid export membrane protein